MLVICVESDYRLKVIHFTMGLQEMEIKEEVLPLSPDVIDCMEVLKYVELPPDATAYTPEVAITNARSKVGENGYKFFSNNCEHFINWAKTGVSHSGQVDRAVVFVGVGVVGAILIGIAAIFGRSRD